MELDAEGLFYWFKRRKVIFGTMAVAPATGSVEMNETWPDTFDEGCIHQFLPGTTNKNQTQQQKHPDQRYIPIEYLLDDHENHPIQHEIILS